ncbi:putative defense protein Hdd11 [Anthonomus grandis grandis]|uniref:putative defense protein Hdd11 n=1 Tax=Anthonomus grandis grandis TaxID=2921223 RepID=UPI0021667067|nr:putative defense protein Hdd11 [Anthonomus grandis grandis]
MSKLIAFTVLSLVASAWAYSAGAPEGVCDDMTPKHPVDPQKSRMPYKISIEKAQVKSGDEVKIGIDGKAFKGFFLQVRDGNKAVGSFQIPGDDKYLKTVNCHGTKASGATHKNSVEKKEMYVTWKAPAKAGKYTVYATVAEDGGTFWAQKPSGIITVE